MSDPSRNGIGNEDRFEILSEATFEGICIHDQGIILDTNQQFCDMFGYSLYELKGMECFNLIAPQSQEAVKEYISTGFPGPYESYSQRKDGSTFPTEVRVREFQQDGKIFRLAVFRDITERKEMERQIAESEKRYRELYNLSPIALYRTRISDGKLLECNQTLVELFGYDSKEEFQTTTAMLDLAWPNGLQEGFSQPVALLIDEGADTEEAANSQGFRYFTNVDDFKDYVISEVLGEKIQVV